MQNAVPLFQVSPQTVQRGHHPSAVLFGTVEVDYFVWTVQGQVADGQRWIVSLTRVTDGLGRANTENMVPVSFSKTERHKSAQFACKTALSVLLTKVIVKCSRVARLVGVTLSTSQSGPNWMERLKVMGQVLPKSKPKLIGFIFVSTM